VHRPNFRCDLAEEARAKSGTPISHLAIPFAKSDCADRMAIHLPDAGLKDHSVQPGGVGDRSRQFPDLVAQRVEMAVYDPGAYTKSLMPQPNQGTLGARLARKWRSDHVKPIVISRLPAPFMRLVSGTTVAQ